MNFTTAKAVLHWTYLPSTRLSTSRTILLSNSTAITFFDCSRSRIVRLPVPGPISRVISVGFRPARATILQEPQYPKKMRNKILTRTHQTHMNYLSPVNYCRILKKMLTNACVGSKERSSRLMPLALSACPRRFAGTCTSPISFPRTRFRPA